jgi:two-component system invasion response regulator UvrY
MINIGIVDDHAVIRAGLREFLAGFEDLSVMGEAANAREAVELVQRTDLDLDVLVLDLVMPGQSGQDVLATIKVKVPNLAVLILRGYPEELYAVTLIGQGASGYLNKDCAPEVMVDAIRTVAKGQRYFTPAVVELSAQRLQTGVSTVPHEQLTSREFQVFVRLAQGKVTQVICDELALSAKTIGHHRTQLMRKMELRSNGDLTYYAIKNRLIDESSGMRVRRA